MNTSGFFASSGEAVWSVGQTGWQAAVILVLLLLNGFFVAAEFAILKVRRNDLEELQGLEGRKSKAAKAAMPIIDRLDNYLAATQLGITLSSIGLGMLGGRYLESALAYLVTVLQWEMAPAVVRGGAFAIAFAVIAFLHIVIGELMPRSLAIRKALPTTLFVSGPLRLFAWLFYPVIRILNFAADQLVKLVFRIEPISEAKQVHSEEELLQMVTESERSNNVTETERDIFVNALELNDRLTREVMTPRSNVIVLDSGVTFEENLRIALDSKHTRFPLVDGHLDVPLGIIHVKDMLGIVNEVVPDLKRIQRKAVTVPELMPLDKLLHVFLSKHAHMALVIDEFGGTVGMVTLDNVVEELIGDIQDEFDTDDKGFHRVDDDEFFVDGTFPLYELSEYCDLQLEHPDVATIGGYVTDLIGHLPSQGEQIDLEGYQVTTEQADARRVIRLRFRKLDSSAVA